MESKELSKIGSYEFFAEPFHCDFRSRLFMGHLGNHMLNAADFHSHDRGFGMTYLNTIHRTWVLSRLAIEMEEMPKAYDRFKVDTWVESALRFFTNRSFKVHDPATGRVYGYGRSIWAMIDTETRQPANLFEINDGALLNYVEKDTVCPIDKGSRVRVPEDAQLVREFTARYSDIDVNGHVNSVKYIEHVLDVFPLEWFGSHRIHRFEVAYVAEAHCDDRLRIYRHTDDGLTFVMRMTKTAPGSEEEVEVCRSMATFVQE